MLFHPLHLFNLFKFVWGLVRFHLCLSLVFLPSLWLYLIFCLVLFPGCICYFTFLLVRKIILFFRILLLYRWQPFHFCSFTFVIFFRAERSLDLCYLLSNCQPLFYYTPLWLFSTFFLPFSWFRCVRPSFVLWDRFSSSFKYLHCIISVVFIFFPWLLKPQFGPLFFWQSPQTFCLPHIFVSVVIFSSFHLISFYFIVLCYTFMYLQLILTEVRFSCSSLP